ncbi:MAG: peptide ABC transporter substrate-binding protein [Gemmatimonadales bacterium]|nr:peptide ABC transporter substrate-binding protein [Gemmatimonadales bacterium]
MPFPMVALALLLQAPAPTTVTIAVGQEPTRPIPTLLAGQANIDVAAQLFLPLAHVGPKLVTSGDKEFEPALARRWTRRDDRTLAFDLDPRARWHDGAPVTSADVVFTLARAKDAAVSPTTAPQLAEIESVTAEGDGRVVFRFRRAYGEQLYDAIHHVSILPAHLLAALPPADVERSAFMRQPVGSGPYRWVRQVPGELTELAAVPDFFLGRPGVERVIFRLAADPEARLNLLLSGAVDALDNVIPPLANLERVRAQPGLRVVAAPTTTLGFMLMNQQARGRGAPHPVLGDLRVRQALIRALDRETMVRAALGDFAKVPYGPVSQLLWIDDPSERPPPPDTALARRLLAEAGYRDADGDGVLERNGQPLRLGLMVPAPSALRRQLALVAQAQWRAVGVQADIEIAEVATYLDRRRRGDFDLDFSATTQDPTPSTLLQSWTCAGVGANNVASYCAPQVDSLLAAARFGRGDTRRAWRAVVRRIEADAPAVFLFATANASVLSRRLGDAALRPDSWWRDLYRWRVRPDGR